MERDVEGLEHMASRLSSDRTPLVSSEGLVLTVVFSIGGLTEEHGFQCKIPYSLERDPCLGASP